MIYKLAEHITKPDTESFLFVFLYLPLIKKKHYPFPNLWSRF